MYSYPPSGYGPSKLGILSITNWYRHTAYYNAIHSGTTDKERYREFINHPN